MFRLKQSHVVHACVIPLQHCSVCSFARDRRVIGANDLLVGRSDAVIMKVPLVVLLLLGTKFQILR